MNSLSIGLDSAGSRDKVLDPMSQMCRRTGVERIGDVPWGTHLCHFFQTKEDILDVLVPYFRAGLESNEACMWVTSDPVDVEFARDALCGAVPTAMAALASGQLEILPHEQWYLRDGTFCPQRVIEAWAERTERAIRSGREGLRVSGNTFWLEQAGWHEFAEYERAVNQSLGRFRMMAICTYSLDRCGPGEILDVANNHHFALVKRAGAWEVLESSERRRVAEALRASEERCRRIIETAAEGIVTLDQAFAITFVNERMAELLGVPAEQMVGRPLRDFVHEHDRSVAVSRLTQADCRRFELRLRQAHGRMSWASISKSSFADHDARASGVLLMVTDITRRKWAEQEREQLLLCERAARAEAEDAVQMRERIMAVLGHDLRHPLQIISSAAELMSQQSSSGAGDDKRVDMIQRSVRRMDTMIQALLDFARGRSGGIPIAPEEVDLGALCREALECYRATHSDRVIRLEIDGDCCGMWDPVRLSQVISNLTNNALMHGAAGTPVVIRVRGREQDVVLEVENLGNPIPPARLNSIFEPFARVCERGLPGGLGLGLFIVSEIVAAHGGEVSVRSCADRGTTFTVRLPR